ncbi:deoxyuridine 5'-triphosphate nucleotidohydrolase-like [Ambystoma mexicanum]|uniref:deoxyuridine 5'-triphosphate nucleotidohydrolase-like n=1 Tax=Ambystoma mexicanum TaxID=8296 RepID=UPI0037E749EB
MCDRASNPSVTTTEPIRFNLSSSRDVTIEPGERQLIPTDLVLAAPKGTYIWLVSKSWLVWKYGFDVMVAVVDTDSRGDANILLQNNAYHVKIKETIAQGILVKVLFPKLLVPELDSTERGDKDFGEAEQDPDPNLGLPKPSFAQAEAEIIPDLAFGQRNDPVLA